MQNTFLKAVVGAISAPFKVLSRNMGHEDAFIRNPEAEQLKTKMRLAQSEDIIYHYTLCLMLGNFYKKGKPLFRCYYYLLSDKYNACWTAVIYKLLCSFSLDHYAIHFWIVTNSKRYKYLFSF